ncbi:MAG: calcium-binding protein [Chakrabartia sp.]
MADDYPNTTLTTGVVTPNGRAAYASFVRSQGVFEATGDIDLFKVDLVAGRTYIFSMTAAAGTTIDPLLLLFYPFNTLVAGNDDASTTTRNSQIIFTAAVSGTYYLQANSYANATGAYSLTAWEVGADIYAGDTTTTGVLTVGSAGITDLFEAANDRDAFAVTLTAGLVYRFDLVSVDATIDTYLTLRNAAGGLLFTNDDREIGTSDSQLLFAPTTTGIYYVAAEEYNGAMGAYRLQATALALLKGTDIANTLTGTAADEALLGLGGNDTLTGNAGNDYLDGGLGADKMAGGAGNDTYVVDISTDTVTEGTSAGTDTVRTTLASYTLGANIENLVFTGAGNFTGTGNTLANMLQGGAGNDTLNGGTGADVFYGGAGDDIYIVDNLADFVSETANAGTDQIQSSISWTLGDYIENLTLTGTAKIDGTGNADANVLTGNSAVNILNGLGGADLLDGKAGTDILDGGDGSDIYLVLTATDHGAAEFKDSGALSDVDEVRFATTTAATLTLYAADTGIERVVIGTGTAAAAVTTGTVAANINAQAAPKGLTLVGNSGNNIITGTAFSDVIDGGAGNDTFRFLSALNGATNVDRLLNYNVANDVIHLENAIFTKLVTTGALAAANFAANATGTATDANDYILYNTTTGALFYDADGNGAGAAVQFALIQGLTGTFAATEFVII